MRDDQSLRNELQALTQRVEAIEDRDSPRWRWNRRGFMTLTGAAAVGALLGTGTARAEHSASTDFHGMALLIGPRANRPGPGSSFFDDKVEYHYQYVATDTGARYTIETGDADWSELPVHLVNYQNAELPASPEQGVMYFDTDRDVPAWWDGETYEFPSHVADVKSTPETVVGTDPETTIFTADIDGGSLLVGRTYDLDIFGQFTTASSSETFTLRVKAGGVTIATITSTAANETNAPFKASTAIAVELDGVNGQLESYTSATFANENKDEAHGASTVDTTTATTFEVTIEWAGADAGNSLTVELARFDQKG